MGVKKFGLSTKVPHKFSVGDYIFDNERILKVMDVKSKKSAVVREAYNIEYLIFGLKFLFIEIRNRFTHCKISTGVSS